MKDKLLIRFRLRPERKNVNDELPVYCYLRLGDKQYMFLTPYSITPATYSKYNKDKQKLLYHLNKMVAELRVKIESLASKLCSEKKPFTLEEFTKELKQIEKDQSAS